MRTATQMSDTGRFRATCMVCRVDFDSTPEAPDHRHLTLPLPERRPVPSASVLGTASRAR
jgi:hypothetical protein